jgi:hypothetical protein
LKLQFFEGYDPNFGRGNFCWRGWVIGLRWSLSSAKILPLVPTPNAPCSRLFWFDISIKCATYHWKWDRWNVGGQSTWKTEEKRKLSGMRTWIYDLLLSLRKSSQIAHIYETYERGRIRLRPYLLRFSISKGKGCGRNLAMKKSLSIIHRAE